MQRPIRIVIGIAGDADLAAVASHQPFAQHTRERAPELTLRLFDLRDIARKRHLLSHANRPG